MDKKDCPYAFICHHQIKIQCNPLNKETILNKIYEILHSITVRKDHFISKSSKLGRFLISGQSQMKLKHLLDLNSCLAIALDENHRSRSNTQRININLLLGTIEKEGAKNADVIVNSISLRNYASGAIAKALYTAGGKQYHSECKTQLDSLGAEDIGSTSGSFFGCKKVYHIPFLSSCKSISWLKDKLKCCLEKANKESMKSIAIPAIGIGKIGLQIDQVIPGMFDVISNYSHQHKNNTSLKTVYFVTLPTQTDHHRQFRALLRDRNDSLIGQQDQLIATSDTMQCPDNTVTATISAAIPFNQIHDHKTIPLVTKSSNSNVVHKSNLSYELYFTVHCYNESKCKLFRVNLYHGNIMGATTKSILDMTALCDQHRQLKTLDGIMESNSPQHTLKTLQYLPNFHSNYNLYQICPYGCLTGVNQLLKSISTYGDQSVSLPLPGIEFNEEHTYQIFKAIELFLTNNDHNGNRLDCIDFALGSKDRVEEIATWIREEITKSRLKLRWEITFNRTKQQNGFKIIYVSKFFTKMNQLQSIINEYGQSWGSFEIADDDYFIHVDKNRWHQISLEFWCQYNTILVGYNQNKMIRIHGYESDILKAISAIHKLFASRLKEKSDIEVQEVIAKNIPWYAVIDQSKVQFDSKLNYEIVKNYEIYCHNKTKMIFNVDSGRKSIDYKEMIITVDGKQYPIGQFASSCKDIAVPPHWDTADGITDGYYRTFDVTNPKERNEISLLLGNHQILRLTRIQNWNLYRRYQIMKKEVESTVQKYQPGTQVERKLFHGTTTANTDIICRKGFDRDFSGKSRGSALGTGTYFAISATTSLSYGKTLIIARVLTGVYANAGCSNKPNLSIIPGSKSERIHSVVDNMNNPSVFVVSNDNSAYPEYIVHV
ncbi:uncharacterized protein TRIADDRAFT_61289 [Trichoplax adhaerens]|uniref:Poly [ADP-ribose] polymerase n=1 Tax=Trichoplax adhaerens TaxID=10228 RepID=B3SAK2_TRIAD|nr:hypothetical protein TRIADDRAFT_61289 [Trichoplax adhaerens]EDV20326.1 hypothetical protein TRIADDRAFT_61289 [Trichoplax adhaerens]|eukprot:XP_002117276.1 hypothetical protein TRIADDRAFT_61289 [Trichoplax adhaerens]